MIEMGKMMQDCPAEMKLSWVRSQIIDGGGSDSGGGGESSSSAEFNSSFGKRRITYADSTATARSLHFIEDYIISNVLPFYGNFNSFLLHFLLVYKIISNKWLKYRSKQGVIKNDNNYIFVKLLFNQCP